MAVSDFFLPSANTTSTTTWTPPSRTGVEVTPMIDGVETFAAYEKAIKEATKTVWFAAWLFAQDSFTTSTGDQGGKRVGNRWADWFLAAAKRGVQVRLLLTDFDPYLGPHHEHAWEMRAYLLQERTARKIPPANLEVMCSQHPAVLDVLAQVPPIKTAIRRATTRILTELNSHPRPWVIQNWAYRPGMWARVPLSAPGVTPALPFPVHRDVAVRPATHHQKIMVVDGAIGFCGGLDVNWYRWDSATAEHRWHDLHLRLRGDVVLDLERNFLERWNTERGPANAFVTDSVARKPAGVVFSADRATALTSTPLPSSTPGGTTAQLQRTVSEDGVPLPNTLVQQVWDGYLAAISQAQQYIYVENQYLRSTDLVLAIIDRAATIGTLQVVMVVPIAPEELSTPPLDPATLKGMNLQFENLTRLTATLGARFGVYSPLQRVTRALASGVPAPAADHLGSPQVYVHSKCMIIDDVYANIGSPNAGDRSFLMDTECAVAFHDPAKVKALRVRLWRELTGQNSATWALSGIVARWNAVATANAAAAATARSGYVVPHPFTAARLRGTPNLLIPDRFTELERSELPPAGIIV